MSGKELCVWSEEMEAAYDAALVKVGGLDAAKPKAVLAELEPQFPHLTIQNVKWHLAAHRRRVERHRIMAPQKILPPTKWGGRMEEAYEREVARQGGLALARPTPLLAALQGEFPQLTLQTIKWHLQGQRRREQRLAQRAAAAGQGDQDQQQQQQQQQQQAGPDSDSTGGGVAGPPAGPRGGASSGGGITSSSCGATSQATPAGASQQQQQQQQPAPAAPLPQHPPPVQHAGQAGQAGEAAALPTSSWQHSGATSSAALSTGAASDCQNTLQQAAQHATQQAAQQAQDRKKRRQQVEPGPDGAEACRRLVAALEAQAAASLNRGLQREDEVMAERGQAAAPQPQQQRAQAPPTPQQHLLSQMLAMTHAQAEAQQQWVHPWAASSWRPWQPYLLPVAERDQAQARLAANCCRQVALVVQQRAMLLAELVRSLEEHDVLSGPMGEALGRYVEAASVSGESDEALLMGVLSKLLAAVGSEGTGSHSGGGMAAEIGNALPVPSHFQKQQRIVAALTAAFPAGPDLPGSSRGAAGSGALAAAPPASGSWPGGSGGGGATAHSAATCTLPNCLRCKYEARLARQQQEQQEQQQHHHH